MEESEKRAVVLATSYLWVILYFTHELPAKCNIDYFLINFTYDEDFLLRAIKKLEEFDYLKLDDRLLNLTSNGKKFVEDVKNRE